MKRAPFASLAVALGLSLLSGRAARAQDCDHCEAPDEERPVEVGVGLDAAFYSPGGTNQTFTGIGLNLRHHFDERLAIEGTVGAFRAQDATAANPYAVRAYPVQASVLGYVFPRSPLKFYGLAGATLEESNVADTTANKSWNYSRAGGHVGVGAELVTGRVTWQMDTRYVIYGNNPSKDPSRPPAPFPGSDAHLFRLGATMYF